ncbi:beta-propeller domain-containing protein [Sphingomicrobium flavum]|uniref:beta-propeller domain-containing protein n=1 Tax=Sphingomicrobium flavum TaxID=1229164 RepID=UPI0021ADDC7D|nr:beta-propeller domain-containing protein [Sphingomicrobium flavum]
MVARLLFFIGTLALAACSTEEPRTSEANPSFAAGGHLEAFESVEAFEAFLKSRREQKNDVQYESALPATIATAEEADSNIVLTGSRTPSDDAITNVQEAGVDEGGIVKKRGDILVVLRRGRLFTLSIAGGQLRKIDEIDAYPPGVSGDGSWYDEMLLAGNMVVVVGYSYDRGGTEINRFSLSANGKLTFKDASHLRSNDYYSSRNYASRLIGNRLVYYAPLYLNSQRPFESFPALRRWTGDEDRAFERMLEPTQVYVAPRLRDRDDTLLDTLHSVIECDLGAPTFDCSARAVLGPASRTFYVSPTGVYLWVSDAWHWRARDRNADSFLYRLPFDGDERPSAIATRGQPTDQFSFREDRAAGVIDILVRAQGGGDAMWRPEVTGGDVALLSVPISWLGDGSRQVTPDRYRDLPRVEGYNFQNRFVGDHVLYGGGNFGAKNPSLLVAAKLRDGPVTALALPHMVERIDQMGQDGIAIGSDPSRGLVFTAIDLADSASLGSAFRFPDAQQGEQRSHAFFYRPDSADGENGLLGLPVAKPLERSVARFLGSDSSVLFLERKAGELDLAGEIEAATARAVDDGCVASCVDWYGNARPIFIGKRVFALMGYELVEGELANGRIVEQRRLDFAPTRRSRERPPTP